MGRLKIRKASDLSVVPPRADIPGQHTALASTDVDIVVNRYLLVRVLAEMGLLDNEIALALNMNAETFATHLRNDPHLREALILGKRKPDQQVQMALFQTAMGYQYEEVAVEEEYEVVVKDGVRLEVLTGKKVKKGKKHQPGNVTAQIFWLKNRLPEVWRDRVETTITLRDRAELAHRLVGR